MILVRFSLSLLLLASCEADVDCVEGYSVILSATWVLPVALIPSTWKENDFPKSPTQPAPIPLPPASSQWTPSSPPASLPTSSGSASPIQVAPLYPSPSLSPSLS
ncbi:hypothetical protein GALMADRAFT_257761 [Galerina marginata CBS 339.88]|uniref:Uncharacterized protein n=1 Tax=Galerina marginata (strain CBS 339.88) TaxID=685588 RepID=A0A067SD21_GALM3|nr:hypothetical protein GALMADRAFT_257761 [Galerina marginata CBS 339.88]